MIAVGLFILFHWAQVGVAQTDICRQQNCVQNVNTSKETAHLLFYTTSTFTMSRSAIRFHIAGEFVRFEYCQVINERFSIQNAQSFSAKDCYPLGGDSENASWLGLCDADEINAWFINYLKKSATDTQKYATNSRIINKAIEVLPDVFYASFYFAISRYIAIHPSIDVYPRASATGRLLGFFVRRSAEAMLAYYLWKVSETVLFSEDEGSEDAEFRGKYLNLLIEDLKDQPLLDEDRQDAALDNLLIMSRDALDQSIRALKSNICIL